MGKKIPYDELLEKAKKELFLRHGESIQILDFKGTGIYRGDFFFECKKCERKWWGKGGKTILKGAGCRICSHLECSKKRFFPKEKIFAFLEQKGLTFIEFSEEFRGARTKFFLKYGCGHEGESYYNSLFNHETNLCPSCSRAKGKEKISLSWDEIERRAKEAGFTLLSIENPELKILSNCEYSCPLGHITKRRIRSFISNPTCGPCKREKMRHVQAREKSFRWQGGTTQIRAFLRKNLTEWNKESAKNCNYKCVIENKEFDAIHHLYGFNLILRDCFLELDIPRKENISEYTTEEIEMINNKCLSKHNELLGVCLTKRAHVLYHNTYGYGNNTPEQFEEFKRRIRSGELILPEN